MNGFILGLLCRQIRICNGRLAKTVYSFTCRKDFHTPFTVKLQFQTLIDLKRNEKKLNGRWQLPQKVTQNKKGIISCF